VLIGVILILVVQFALMPSTTDWEEASDEMENAEEGETMWIEGEITSKEEIGEDHQSYEYRLDDIDEPAISYIGDLGDEGDTVRLKVERTELGIRVKQEASSYPILFYIGIAVVVIGGCIVGGSYLKRRKKEKSSASPSVDEQKEPPSYDVSTCPKCKEQSLKTYGDGSAFCENCGHTESGETS